MFLKLINNSTSKSKENHNREGGWIPGLNQHRFLRFDFFVYSLVLVSTEKIHIKHSRQCFIGYPNASNFVKNTPLRVVFSTVFSVFGRPEETPSLVFGVLIELLRIGDSS